MQQNNAEKQWRIAVQLANNFEWHKASALYRKLLKTHPNNEKILLQSALAHAKSNDYSSALQYIEHAHNLNPSNIEILLNYAVICSRLSLIDKSENLLEHAYKIDPNNFDVCINLCAIKNIKEDFNSALDFIKKAISLKPDSAKAYGILGAIFVKIGSNDFARKAFNLALKLDANYLEPHLNLASLEAIEGNSALAINLYEELLSKNINNDLNSLPVEPIKFSLSFEYLKNGLLKKGWEYYEYGFSPNISIEYSRRPNRVFSRPRWDGSTSESITLLIWGEQGIGDELIFMTCIPDVIASGVKVIIECQERLVSLISRSFPTAKIRASSNLIDYNQELLEDFDYQIPVGSLMSIYRQNISDFPLISKYIVVDNYLAKKFNSRLIDISSNRKKVGICWRSGKLNAERNIHYTSLLDWGPILNLENYDFINLQYGDCENELIEVEKKFNKRIYRWIDIDLKNDFESTMALMSNLDIVITVGTAVCPMAASLGLPVILLAKPDWVNLGTDYFPFFRTIECIFPKKGKIVSDSLKDVATVLQYL